VLTHFNKYRIDYLFILLIIVVSLLTLLFKIGEMPPAAYPWSDESDVASDAVYSYKHGIEFHYPAQLAGGPIAVWLETGWMYLFGPGLTGLRLLNGLVNLTSILLLYLLVRHLPFRNGSNWQWQGITFSQWLGLTSALFMAVSTWILGLARIATPNWSLVPPLTTLTFYFLWQALNTNRRRYFVAMGITMGALYYGYIPGYCVPLVPLIFWGSLWFGKQRQMQLIYPISRWYWVPFGVALVVATPIFVYFALHPNAVLQRVTQLSHTNELSLSALFSHNLIDTLSAFGFWPNWLLQGRFEYIAFDPLVTVLFVGGLLIGLWRWRDNIYFFLMVWWVVMIAPAFLSRSASIGFIFEVWRRGIGAQPVSFVFIGLAVITTAQWLQRRIKQQRLAQTILPVLVGVTLLIAAFSSFWLYFDRWTNSGVIPMLFPAGPVRLVEWMEKTTGGPDTLFIFPIRPKVSPTVRPEIFTVRYLYDGQGTNVFPALDETTIDRELATMLATKPSTVNLMLHDRIVVDPKGYFAYALGSHGRIVGYEQVPDYRVTTYRMNSAAAFETSIDPVDVLFGDELRLTGWQIQPDNIVAGQNLGVTLRWLKPGVDKVDYNASLVLSDGQGYEWARVDQPLLSPDDYLTTRHWPPGTESTLYYLLPIPPDIPPGEYSLQVVAYNAETGVPLSPAGGRADLSYPLANVDVGPGSNVAAPAKLAIMQPLDVQFPDGLVLVGTNPIDSVQRSGNALWVNLWWKAIESPSKNIGLVLALATLDGEPIPLFETPQPLVAGFPTSAWELGQVYRANSRVLLPASLETNRYVLALRLFDLDTLEPLAEQLLFPISVEARHHVFERPPLANQLNIDFEDSVRLLGTNLSVSAAGIKLKTQWQALRPMTASYKIFVHFADTSGHIISQLDMPPQQGAAPTTSWVPGEIIEDELTLAIPTELPPGPYRLVIGLYDEKTGQRLRVGQQDHVILFERDGLQ